MTVYCAVSILKVQGVMPIVDFLLLQLQNPTTSAQ